MVSRKPIVFAELGLEERKLLLRAFDYDVDDDGYVLDAAKSKIPSQENPRDFLKVENAVLAPGSLKVVDSSPTSISKLIREAVGINGDSN